MDNRDLCRSQHTRQPLSDATHRVINASSRCAENSNSQVLCGEKSAFKNRSNSRGHRQSVASRSKATPATRASASAVSRTAPGPKPDPYADKRASQISTSSGASSSKRKTHVGPWHLGKTLGKGSAGRVRLARHSETGENVAVKILPKHGVRLTQAGSLQDIDAWDQSKDEFKRQNRMPLSIEREVALLKLIDHPNIMKIYDIWENRSEIYLVLEYVNHGDLFEYINEHHCLREDETIFFFRQIISALDYCHSFNICHRDLKPENILISNTGQIKVADFGMAAIHQGPTHWLQTACGSPHYAAPELVSQNRGYQGHKIDVWSAGVILYACLCGSLPFDDRDGDLKNLLKKAQIGRYSEPEWLSWLSRDLIRRMLQPNPDRRISIREIWEHDLIKTYDGYDDLRQLSKDDFQLDTIRQNGRQAQVTLEDVDLDIVRQLKSMWHTYSEEKIIEELVGKGPSEKKLFYHLLLRYTEKQLENYRCNIPHSPSDFHHLQPTTWKRKLTTLEFPGRPGRVPSRFTVISNVATDDNGIETATDAGGTIRSYDPFKSSRIMGENEASHAKITVHRNGSSARSSTRVANGGRIRNGSIRSSSTYSRHARYNRRLATTPGLRSTRRSLTSSLRSGDGTPYKRNASRHKRGVDFSRVRKQTMKGRASSSRGPASIAGDDTTYGRDRKSSVSSVRQGRRPKEVSRGNRESQTMAEFSRSNDTGLPWNEELRHFSYSIAKDCDQAFNSSLLLPESVSEASVDSSPVPTSHMGPHHDARSLSVAMETPTHLLHDTRTALRNPHQWDTRPLPPAPPTTESKLHGITVAKKRVERHHLKSNEFKGHVERMVSNLNKLVPSGVSKKAEEDRRTVSAPIYSRYSTQWGNNTVPLPSIHEAQPTNARLFTAPVNGRTSAGVSTEETALEYLARQDNTIRVVQSPSAKRSPVKAPAPLNIRKCSANRSQVREEVSSHQDYTRDEITKTIPEEPATLSRRSSSGGMRKKSSWFKRASKDKDDLFRSRQGSSSGPIEELSYTESSITSAPAMPPTKKKSFSFAFWRNSKDEEQMKLSLAGPEFDESPSPEPLRTFTHPSRPSRADQRNENVATRNIEPQQNWLARLFRVKPATDHLCFNIPRRRVRQEIAILLKEWRRYGIRDIQVDKGRNIVFGRVGSHNYLHMKEVSFAAEIMTVIEHGKRNPLSIVRFTQERGAASSFHKVVETMHAMFDVRNLLVTDKRKVKMMIKTLNA
ncbi:Pkinase-domain-containing protein [Apiospora kogelbergensis]|uniref:non-specific serine/threonine protein kinase n=1 Tax=Apiospora kogelbergensis TaxID=1337665 RepID=A0AAW0QPQ6_9PEZI